MQNVHFGKMENMDKLEPGDHSVLLYEEEKETLNPVVSFIKNSLKRGEICLYIQGDANTKLINSELQKERDDFSQLIKTRQLQFLSKEETYALSDQFEADKMITLLKNLSSQAIEDGYTGLSITGELSWVLNYKRGKEELIKYEWLLNDEIFDNYPVIALCRYNLNKFDNEIIKSILELHHYIIWKDNLYENPYYIEPDGFKNNRIVEYKIKTWLKNIQEFKKRESKFKRKLKSKNNEYEFLFNKINDEVFLLEIQDKYEDSKFIKVNDKACEVLGYTREEFKEISPSKIVPERIVEEIHQKIFTKLFKENKFSYESVHINKNKKSIPVETKLNAYRENGKKYLLAISRDISDRKEKQKKIMEANDELQEKYMELEANNEEIRAMNEDLERTYKELDILSYNLENIIELISKIGTDTNKEEFLSIVLKKSMELIPEADHGLIYLFENGKAKFIDAVGYNIDNINKLDIKRIHMKNHDKFYIKEIEDNNIIDKDKAPIKLYDHYQNNIKKIKNSLLVNILVNDNIIGRMSIEIKKDSSEEFTENAQRTLYSIERLASSYLTLKNYNRLQREFTDEVIISLTNLLEIHDDYTKGHNETVANISREIAREMDLSQKIIEMTYWAGLLHDIGKMIIPKNILNKKGKLSENEYFIIKKHPVWGYETLKNSIELREIAEYILYHHERWDGNGYPKGIKGDQIPIISQILSVADAWDAMTSERPYRNNLSKKEALEELISNKGTQFSPKIVERFINSSLKDIF